MWTHTNRAVGLTPKGGEHMTTYQALMLMLTFGLLIVELMNEKNSKK